MKKNKKSTAQLTLPMILPPREVKEYAKQHWNITFARQKKVSVYAKRMMANVMAQIRDNDFDLLPYYQMRVGEIVPPDAGLSGVYGEIKKAFIELVSLHWLIEDIDKKQFAPRHLLNTSDAKCGYDNGIITIVLNPLLKPYFIEIAHYSTYELKHYMTFKSWYSMRMFEILSAYKDTGIWETSIVKFRELMDCQEKYPLTKDLIKRTLSEPLQELETTKMAFSYEPVIEERFGRGTRAIVGLRFRLKNVELKEIPASWFEFSPDHKEVLLKLKAFKVSEPNILRYAAIIGIDGAKKLIREWEEKERSNRRIDDKAKYCNAVWVKQGKEQGVPN